MRRRTAFLLAAAIAGALALVVPAAADSGGGRAPDPKVAPTYGQAERVLPPMGHAKALQSLGCVDDGRGDPVTSDTARTSAPEADITTVCADYAATGTATLTVAVATPTDPKTDPNWQGFTSAQWHIDVDADDVVDFVGFFGVDQNGALVGEVDRGPDGDFDFVCAATPTYDGTKYQVVFPASCIGSPSSFRMQVAFGYDYQPADPLSDVALDGVPADGSLLVQSGGSSVSQVPPVPRTIRVSRLAGPDRIATAIEISRHEFPGGVDEVYLADAFNFPDALAGGELSAGPVLLVPSCGPLPDAVKAEIQRLDPLRVIALGGPNAVCDATLNEASTL